MWRRRLLVLAIQLLIFAVLVELGSVASYFYDTGQWYYGHRPVKALIAETTRGELTGDVLHPYFGPIHRTGVRPETNNVGFGSPHKFPFMRANDRQFLLGIFGGSVARLFCDRGAERLVAELRWSPRFAGRDIVPLCFAHEGYKQPQQLLVLAYFLSIGQQFDAVVNIDGFNEVALGTYNNDRGHDVSMPSPLHLDPLVSLIDRSTMTSPMLYSLAAINRDKERMNALAAQIQEAPLASWGFVLDRYYEFTRDRYQKELARFETLATVPASSLIQITPALKARRGDELYSDIADAWASASLLMRDMLAARSASYVHVLQPNQYYSRHKFNDAEARLALNPATPFKPAVERGYPALRRAGQALGARETFIDATALFDTEMQPVFEDDCCHYTTRGYERLAELLAAKLAAAE
jgi:hypothetical protein